MHRLTRIKLGVVIAMVAAATALAGAEPRPAFTGWPEPHAGSYLGVHIDEVTPQTASALKLSDTSGALIAYVDQDGPACRAGLKSNDVVVGFNGSKVQNPEQFQDLIHATPGGKTVSLTVVRNGQKKDISATLGAWPNPMAHAQSFAPLHRGFMPVPQWLVRLFPTSMFRHLLPWPPGTVLWWKTFARNCRTTSAFRTGKVYWCARWRRAVPLMPLA